VNALLAAGVEVNPQLNFHRPGRGGTSVADSRGRMASAIAISEPGAGGDPAAMKTRAVRDGEQWVLNGRKIWISNARAADFIIVMARVGNDARQGGITSFIVDKDTPGFIIEREERPALNWSQAVEQCLLDGLRLPEVYEFLIACHNLGLPGIQDNYEWVGNTPNGWSVVRAGQNACDLQTTRIEQIPYTFRCVI